MYHFAVSMVMITISRHAARGWQDGNCRQAPSRLRNNIHCRTCPRLTARPLATCSNRYRGLPGKDWFGTSLHAAGPTIAALITGRPNGAVDDRGRRREPERSIIFVGNGQRVDGDDGLPGSFGQNPSYRYRPNRVLFSESSPGVERRHTTERNAAPWPARSPPALLHEITDRLGLADETGASSFQSRSIMSVHGRVLSLARRRRKQCRPLLHGFGSSANASMLGCCSVVWARCLVDFYRRLLIAMSSSDPTLPIAKDERRIPVFPRSDGFRALSRITSLSSFSPGQAFRGQARDRGSAD